MSNAGISFGALSTALPHVAAARHPILIRGRHGVGKSEGVYQFAAAIGYDVIERRASQMTEGDLLGMPSPDPIEVGGSQAASMRPFSWLLDAAQRPVVLFIDEIDRATMEVRQGFFQLTDSRQIGDVKLHPGTIIIAAVNGGEDSGDYQVNEMDPAELDRYAVFDVSPTTDDWLSWASNSSGEGSGFGGARFADLVKNISNSKPAQPVDRVIVDFIRANPIHLEHSKAYSPNRVYPSRRSWKRLSDALSVGGILDDAKAHRPLISVLTQAYCGIEAAMAFTEYAANLERVLSVEDILIHGKLDRIDNSDWGVGQFSTFMDKVFAHPLFKTDWHLDPTIRKNFVNLICRVPGELIMPIMQGIPTHCVDGDNPTKRIECIKVVGDQSDKGFSFKEYNTRALKGEIPGVKPLGDKTDS